MAGLPDNVTMHTVFASIADRYSSAGICVIDLWPFNRPIAVVATPSAALATQDADLPKPPELEPPFRVIMGGDSLINMSGPAWKTWRGLLNPGFAGGYLLELAPAVVEEVAVFRDALGRMADQGVVGSLADRALRLTIDVIGNVAL